MKEIFYGKQLVKRVSHSIVYASLSIGIFFICIAPNFFEKNSAITTIIELYNRSPIWEWAEWFFLIAFSALSVISALIAVFNYKSLKNQTRIDEIDFEIKKVSLKIKEIETKL